MAAVKYMQLMESVKNSIENGEYKPGDIIPSEKKLGEEYNLSRMSVRKALTLLVEREYLKSIPGKGYYVFRPDSNRYILSFSEEEFVRKYGAEVKLDKIEILQPTKGVATALKINGNKKVIQIKQLYYDDEQAIAYSIKYYPYSKGEAFVESEIDYATHPMKAIKSQVAFTFQKELEINTEISTYEDYSTLGLEEPTPLLVIKQLYIGSNEKPMMWGHFRIIGSYGTVNGVSV